MSLGMGGTSLPDLKVPVLRVKEKCGLHADQKTATAKMKERGFSLSVPELFEAKKLALRRGVWFRALNRLERGALDITIKYYNSVKSTMLTKMLTVILEKLQQATESMVDRMVKSFGSAQARKISGVAVRLGNLSALAWALDFAFARFLAVMHMNEREN
jgi:hypothetical protein